MQRCDRPHLGGGVLLLALVGSACGQSSAPSPAASDAAATKAVTTPATTPTADPAPVVAPPPPSTASPTLATPTPPPSAAFEGPLAATAIDSGALLVWARPAAETGKSELLALMLDERGLERGVPTLLRTTSGEVVAIAVHRRDGDAWVAWVARVAEDPRPRNLVAALRIAADLSAIAAPVTLEQFVGGEDAGVDEIRVLDLADGGAAVGAPSGSADCIDVAEGGESKCPGFDLHWVRADGKSQRAAHFGADGGEAGVGSLVDLGNGVWFDAWAWHGGPTYGEAFARYGASASAPPVSLPTCRPPFLRGFTGAELVTLCDSDYAEDGEHCPLPGEEGTCARVHAVRLDGKAVTPAKATGAPLLEQTKRCADGHPVLEVRWKGGKLVLDPQRAGASLDVDLGVWTGTHALTFGPSGARERWTCTDKGELVLEERIAAELPFAHPSAALQRVAGKL